MGCRILSGDEGACFFDSVTMTAFGPVMDCESVAEEFEKWLDDDPRRVIDIIEMYNKYLEEKYG